MSSWWSIGRIGGVPVRFHWSALLGAAFFSGFRFAPGAWLGFVLVILFHEIGHALVVRVTRQQLLGVDVHGLGGECRWTGYASPLQRASIAWGGVWAQLAVFVVALPVSWVVGSALGGFGHDLFYALTWNSLVLAAINLLPIRPLDGAEAWKLPKLLVERWRTRRLHAARSTPRVASKQESGPRTAPAPGAIPEDLRRIFANVANEARDARRKR